MSSWSKLWATSPGYHLKIWTALTWQHALYGTFTYTAKTAIALFATAPGKTVRTTLVFYSSEETQWVLWTCLSPFMSVSIFSHFPKRSWHLQAMLMNLAPESNWGGRPIGLVVFSGLQLFWSTTQAWTLLFYNQFRRFLRLNFPVWSLSTHFH